MAGELELTPISAVIPTSNGSRNTTRTAEETPFRLDETQFVKADSSEQNRSALAKAIEENRKEPSGRLVIERDEETGKYVQKMVDPASGEVLRQWPEERFLELAKQMGEAYGLLIDRNV